MRKAKRVYTGFKTGGGKPAAVLRKPFRPPRSMLSITRPVGYARTGGFYGRYGPGSKLREDKFLDTVVSFNIDSTPEVPASGQLNLIAQGVTQSQRVGRKCVITSIALKLAVLESPGAAAAFADLWTIMLVLDRQCNGAAAAATDVYIGDLSTTYRNMSNAERFIVLKKWTRICVANAGVTTAYNNAIRHIEYFKRCRIPIEFSSTTGAITEVRSNNIFLLASAFNSDDIAAVAGTCRVKFADG